MILWLQTVGLKVRFAGLLVLSFPVLVTQWLFTSAPWALASLQVVSGGAGLPDTRFWFTPAELHTQLALWGDRGRQIYLTVLWPTDTAFLLAYGTLLTAAFLYLLKKLNLKSPLWHLTALIPVAAAGCDFFENGLTAWNSVLPSGWDPAAWIEAGFTAGKWVFLGLSLAALAGGTVFHLVRSAVNRFRAGRPPVFEPVEPEEPGRN